MKTKNTLGVVIGSILAATSAGAFAQGQGAVEVEAFGKHYFSDSSRDFEDEGELYGAGISYFLTDDVSLGLSYGEYHDVTTNDPVDNGSHSNIKAGLIAFEAAYNFDQPTMVLRYNLSSGMASQSIGHVRSGRDHSNFSNNCAGLKYFYTENLFAKASVDGMHN